MCFLPKRHASIDHAPGPIIARPIASVAKMMTIQKSPLPQQMLQISVRAASVPATGVHKPSMRSIPATCSLKSLPKETGVLS